MFKKIVSKRVEEKVVLMEFLLIAEAPKFELIF